MDCIASYRIASVPQFATDEPDIRAYDSFIGQRALWNALFMDIIGKHRLSVELRFEFLADKKKFDVSLRILAQNGAGDAHNYAQDIKQIANILPIDYQWLAGGQVAESQGQSLRIARIVRKLEFIELPAVSPFLLKMASGNSRADTASSSKQQSSGLASASAPFLNPLFSNPANRAHAYKELPTLTTVFAELHTKHFTMALPGPLDPATSRQKTLYQFIQQMGSGVVSFCIHPVDEALLQSSRIQAMNWKRFLDPFVSDIESSGFTEIQQLKAAYDRFSLPSSYLKNITIRVGANTTEKAVSIANVVSAHLGGTKAFKIYSPTIDSPWESLTLKELDVPCDNWDKKWVDMARSNVVRNLTEQNITIPSGSEIIDFLSFLPHIYTLEDAEKIFRLPVADEEGLPGIDSRLVPPFTVPSLNFLPVMKGNHIHAAPSDKLRLGMVASGGGALRDEASDNGIMNKYQGRAWHSLDKIDLTKHALIVGSTGSGKTMTTLFLARELDRLNVPIMVIEPVKTEYYGRLKGMVRNLYRVRLEGSASADRVDDFLAFDPLRIQQGVTVARHASYIKSCFEAAFPLEPVMALMLENGLLEYYLAPAAEGGCALKKFTRGGAEICRIEGEAVFPSFATFRKYFLDTFLPKQFTNNDPKSSSSSHSKDWQDIFRRRFANLGDGLIGECFKLADIRTRQKPKENYDYFERFLHCHTIVELDAVPDAEHKALLMAFLLTYVFEKRQSEDFQKREGKIGLPSGLRHVMIVEEAHRVLSSSSHGGRGKDMVGQDSKAKAVGLFTDMLAEIRAFGQGLVIVEQIPTKIIPEAVKNTNLKIMLRLTSKDDRDYLGEAMNFTEAQKRFVTNLKVQKGEGINFVVFEEGVDQPLMLSLPLPREPKENWLYDEFFPAEQK